MFYFTLVLSGTDIAEAPGEAPGGEASVRSTSACPPADRQTDRQRNARPKLRTTKSQKRRHILNWARPRGVHFGSAPAQGATCPRPRRPRPRPVVFSVGIRGSRVATCVWARYQPGIPIRRHRWATPTTTHIRTCVRVRLLTTYLLVAFLILIYVVHGRNDPSHWLGSGLGLGFGLGLGLGLR